MSVQNSPPQPLDDSVPPSKIIFLDIDGPMIPYRAMLLEGQTRVMTLFDPVAVGMLNHLCSEHGYRIVLHTSWIRIMGGDVTMAHCVKQGIKAEHFHSDPYCKEDLHWRYDRVAEWLNRHPETDNYVILDDEPFQYGDDNLIKYPDGMSLHHILVNYYTGFMFSTYNDVLAMMKDQGTIHED